MGVSLPTVPFVISGSGDDAAAATRRPGRGSDERGPGTVPRVNRLRRRAPDALALVFTGSGVVHLLRPQSFAAIMPRAIPARHHRKLIYLSGLVELTCAGGLFRRTRWAGPASVATLAAIFPANVQMAWIRVRAAIPGWPIGPPWPGADCPCRFPWSGPPFRPDPDAARRRRGRRRPPPAGGRTD
jgi:uncharacterized membrane protein